MNILSSFKNGVGAVLHVVEAPFDEIAKLEKIIQTGVTEEPEIKAEVLQLIALGTKVVGDGGTALASDGLNFAVDIQTLTDVGSFFAYFKNTFLPTALKVYGEIKTDFAALATTGATPASSATGTADAALIGDHTEVKAGPGLHNTVAA